MKCKLKKLFAGLLLLALSLPAEAGDVKTMVLKQKDGSTMDFPLEDNPVIIFKADETDKIYVKMSPNTEPFDFDIDKIYGFSFPSSIIGDVNGDGKVDIVDVTSTISHILGQPVEINVDTADVNGDGKVDIVDVTSIIDIILK